MRLGLVDGRGDIGRDEAGYVLLGYGAFVADARVDGECSGGALSDVF